MLRCHFTIKPLFWDTFIRGTPSFKSHIVPPAPPEASSYNLVSVTSIEWTPVFRGHCPGLKVIPRLEHPLYYVCIS